MGQETRYIVTTNEARWHLVMVLRQFDQLKGGARRAVRRVQRAIAITDDEFDTLDEWQLTQDRLVLERNAAAARDEIRELTDLLKKVGAAHKKWDRAMYTFEVDADDAKRVCALLDDTGMRGAGLEKCGALLDDLEDCSKKAEEVDERFLRKPVAQDVHSEGAPAPAADTVSVA